MTKRIWLLLIPVLSLTGCAGYERGDVARLLGTVATTVQAIDPHGEIGKIAGAVSGVSKLVEDLTAKYDELQGAMDANDTALAAKLTTEFEEIALKQGSKDAAVVANLIDKDGSTGDLITNAVPAVGGTGIIGVLLAAFMRREGRKNAATIARAANEPRAAA